MSRRRPFIATYRLQLTPAFGFDAAATVVADLAELGVSHLYCSPIFEARPGSLHGYDQTDPTRIRAELGGHAGFDRLVSAARSAGMGLVLDIVPNHMAAHHANPWWAGLLAGGPGSEFDRFFDVDWASAGGKIVLPVLGAPLAEVVERGEIVVERMPSGDHCARYFDHRIPLRSDVPVTDGARTGAGLRALLDAQHHELAYWRDGIRRLNYRRFFDITELAAVRAEDPIVFEALHSKVAELAQRGMIDGVRVDHVDGLRDPLEYLRRLRGVLECAVEAEGRAGAPNAGAANDGAPANAAGAARIPIFVEKILGRNESIPESWPVEGATGYGFLAATSWLMVDPSGVRALRRDAVESHTGARDFRDLSIACKREVAESLLAPELGRLCRRVEHALRTAGMAFEAGALRAAVVEHSSSLAVYRTYGDEEGVSDADAELVRAAAPHALPALADLFTLSGPFSHGEPRAAALEALRSWQQFTGPLAAKGVEDTALYRDVACLSLNDVGTEPVANESTVIVELLSSQRRTRPLWMNATDTHDAKRSEDVRARLAALSRTPDAWIELLHETAAALDAWTGDRPRRPSGRDLSLMIHSVFALLPIGEAPSKALAERLKSCMIKSAREARLSTNWTRPDPDYERSCGDVIEQLLFAGRFAGVRARLTGLASATRPVASRLSIASMLFKTIFPGTPDFYQGTECQALSLVDPDNRRPVDFAERRRLLTTLKARWNRDPAALAHELLRDPEGDRAKLYCTWRALAVRRALMSKGGVLELESFSISTAAWRWSVVAGQTRCVVRMRIDPCNAAVDAQDARLGEADEIVRGAGSDIDQLTARPATDPEWVGIVVEGAALLA